MPRKIRVPRRSPRRKDPGDVEGLARVRVQAAWNRSRRSELRSAGNTSRRELAQLERDGKRLLVFPDGNRHERRLQHAALSASDRLFWVTIAIACGAPSTPAKRAGSPTVAKQYGTLKKARHDLDAFYAYYVSKTSARANVGWFTGGQQHPMLLDFTRPLFAMKFPTSYYLTHPPRPEKTARSTCGGDARRRSLRLGPDRRSAQGRPARESSLPPG